MQAYLKEITRQFLGGLRFSKNSRVNLGSEGEVIRYGRSRRPGDSKRVGAAGAGDRERESDRGRRRQTEAMHSFGFRANAVVTFAVTILAVICAMASLSDNFNVPSPTADAKVLNINWFQKQPNGNDEVSLTLNISADLQSLFTWNTKQVFVFVAAEYGTPENALNQVSLWDGIIPSKEHASFSIHTTNKYRFIDQGSNLGSKYFNLTLHWHVMPKAGKMSADKIVMTGYRLPDEHR